jgi:ZIP family zinc transporter
MDAFWSTEKIFMDFQLLLVTLVAATITMLATGLGAVPFFFLPQLSETWSRWGYALASGVMLAASVFDLLMPAVQRGGVRSGPGRVNHRYDRVPGE